MKIFKNKTIQYLGCFLLFIIGWQVWRVYPQSVIQLQQVQQDSQKIIIHLQSSKDFGTRGFFEINSRLFCTNDKKLNLAAWSYTPTGAEYIGLIEKTPALFDAKQQKYIYQIELELDHWQNKERLNQPLQCRVMTGHYLRGFIRSNVIQVQW